MELVFNVLETPSVTLWLWLHTKVDPPDAEWNEACAKVTSQLARSPASFAQSRHLIISDGGAPGAAQRRKLFSEVLGGKPALRSLVTTEMSNPVKRGIMTAIGWLSPGFEAFAPERARDAFLHLGLSNLEFVWPKLLTMQSKLPPNETLRLMAVALRLPPPVGVQLHP